MNKIAGVSAIATTAISKILGLASTRHLSIKCRFGSSSNPLFRLKLNRIVEMRIVQDFVNHFTDQIEIEIEVTPKEYKDLVDNYKGLSCQVQMYTRNKTGIPKLTPDHTIKALAIFKEKQDLDKRFSLTDLIPKDEKHPEYGYQTDRLVNVRFQLIDSEVYTLRKKQISFMTRDNTMDDILQLVASELGVKKCYIVKSDNKTKFKNFIVPPAFSLENIFDLLQDGDGKGVYEEGLNYYYRDGWLYVYPAYKTDVSTPWKSVHIFVVPNNKLVGLDSFAAKFLKDTHLICNHPGPNRELAQEALENGGTAVYILDAPKMISKSVIQTEAGWTMPGTSTSLAKMNTKRGLLGDTFTPKYDISYGNKYTHLSRLAYANGTIVELGWEHAIPFTFEPGHHVVYHNDGLKVFNQKSGICEFVQYVIQRTAREDTQLYGCTANIRLRVATD